MNFRIFIILISICFLLTACETSKRGNVDVNSNTNIVSCSTENTESTLDSSKFLNADSSILWENAFESSMDINDDGIKENIRICTTGKFTEGFELKVEIDNSQRIYKFSPDFSIMNLIKSIYVNLGQNERGLLLILSSQESPSVEEGKSPPYWLDRSFIIIGYTNSEIVTLLDGMNTPYNKKDNYKRRYVGDFTVEIDDLLTSLSAKIKVADKTEKSDSLEDSIKFQINSVENNNAGVSMNYFDIRTDNTAPNVIQNVICSKYYPGLTYHTSILGIIDYIYKYENNKFVLSKEILKYDELGVEHKKEIDLQKR